MVAGFFHCCRRYCGRPLEAVAELALRCSAVRPVEVEAGPEVPPVITAAAVPVGAFPAQVPAWARVQVQV